MIEAKIDKGNISIECSGNLSELTADVLTLINTIYDQLPYDEAKQDFKDCIINNIKFAFMNDNELDKTVKKKLDRIISILESNDKGSRHEN